MVMSVGFWILYQMVGTCILVHALEHSYEKLMCAVGGQGMICAIAEVESSRIPLAYRFEPRLGEASTGLMQTLQSTAEWLAT